MYKPSRATMPDGGTENTSDRKARDTWRTYVASTTKRNGRFMGRYRDAKGNSKSAGTFATEQEALRAAELAEALANPARAEAVHPLSKRGNVTVAGYFPDWLAGHRLEATSRESYKAMGKHILRELGDIEVRALTPARLRQFVQDLEKRGLSGGTIGHVMTVLHEMIKMAVEDELLTRDIAANVKVAGRKARTMRILTPDEYRYLHGEMPEWAQLIVETLVSTGLRWGEAMGLKKDCVIQEKGRWVIRVRRTIAEVNGKPVFRDYGKTANAMRDVTIHEDLAKRLLANATADGFVFRAKRGGFLSRANFRRVWLKACANIGITGLRVHDLRHTHASWLVNNGANLIVVRDRLGHNDLKTTSRYLHVVEDGPDGALSAFDLALAA